MEDLTGQPVSKKDVLEARVVIQKFLVTGLTALPPELAVQLPNILRCLRELEAQK